LIGLNPILLPQYGMLADVRFGSIASFWQPVGHFRFTPVNGPYLTSPLGPFCAKFGFMPPAKKACHHSCRPAAVSAS
jgi:hypothetical protein